MLVLPQERSQTGEPLEEIGRAPLRIAFGAAFDGPPGYLDTASIGIPPVAAADAVAAAVDDWPRGAASPADFDPDVTAAREAFAALVGVRPERVAAGATVSQLVGLVAAAVPDGTRVLTAATVHAHCVRLADALLAKLQLPPRGQAIVALDVPDAAERLAAAGVRAAVRAGRTRLAFYLYNADSDVVRAVAALRC